MFSAADLMPGFAAVVSSRTLLRRPAMMIWLARAWRASARPRPMPEPPPVMSIVLPEMFKVFFFWSRGEIVLTSNAADWMRRLR